MSEYGDRRGVNKETRIAQAKHDKWILKTYYPKQKFKYMEEPYFNPNVNPMLTRNANYLLELYGSPTAYLYSLKKRYGITPRNKYRFGGAWADAELSEMRRLFRLAVKMRGTFSFPKERRGSHYARNKSSRNYPRTRNGKILRTPEEIRADWKARKRS